VLVRSGQSGRETRRGFVPVLILPVRFRHSWPALLVLFYPLERLWRGLKRRNPPPGSLPAVGWKLFASSLAVSPRARSGNSLLSRSRGNRHGRLGRNSLGRGRQHYEAKDSTRGNESEGKVCKRVAEVSRVGYLTFLQISPNTLCAASRAG
jgi:hypothetical protein